MKLRYILIGALSVTLAGCGTVNPFGKRQANNASVDMADYFAQRVEIGRRHLKEGRPSLAIEAFRQGSYDPRYSAEALNGMGVAYTMLGRSDVARELFARAIKNDPSDARFARNLARLDAVSAPISGGAELAALPGQAPQIARAVERQPEITNKARSPIMTKLVSDQPTSQRRAVHEIFIRTAFDPSAPIVDRTASADSVPAVPKDSSFRKRVSGTMIAVNRPAYPVLIDLTKVRNDRLTVQDRPAIKSYPIRIALDAPLK